jgi:glyoxylase I family protein
MRIKNLGFNIFNSKGGKDIYKVENGKLFKIVAPEGTIIEIRDQAEI